MAKKSRYGQKLPNFSESGVIFCKKLVKSGEIADYWDTSAPYELSDALDSYLNYPKFAVFTKGKFYKYMNLEKNYSFLIRSNENRWVPFNLNFFHEIFRIFV